jgi:UPF0716 family protein affecting phage T7 exclusion
MEGLNLISLLGLLALVVLLTLMAVIGVWLLFRRRGTRARMRITMRQEEAPDGRDPWIESGRRYGDEDDDEEDCVTPSNRA